ncbi:hypothetical protein KSX_86160 [Ktedonospora formicarum]|uniref:Uncharacterized protein n=1 Tax=Ktedonospora formicarum TaxID=2778364 RepID=A0A8J3IAS3_9CHLR|nr:hypothetical protein KSX_86160 [Ktedonospora formicarum]
MRVGIALATTEAFTQHVGVADGPSDLFAQIFGRELGHTRLVSGVYSLLVRTPVLLEEIFEVVV